MSMSNTEFRTLEKMLFDTQNVLFESSACFDKSGCRNTCIYGKFCKMLSDARYELIEVYQSSL